jgi:hypothetical protein
LLPLSWLLHKSIIHSSTQLSTKPKIRSKAPQHNIKETERPSHDWQQGNKVPINTTATALK